jgi:hypothetical protein
VNQTVAEKKFAGKDQNLMTDLLFRFPKHFLVLQSDREWMDAVETGRRIE